MQKRHIFYLFSILVFILFIHDSQEVNAQSSNSFVTSVPTARIMEIVEESRWPGMYNGTETQHQVATVEILEGEYKGEILTAVGEKDFPENESDYWLKENDKVVVQLFTNNGEIVKADIMSHTRDFPIYLLVGIFIALLLFFGKTKGFMSILTLGLTLFIIFKFMLPMLYDGYSPLFLAVMTGSIVTVLTFVMISGFSKKTLAATVGTIGGIISAAILSIIFSQAMRLSGFHSEEERILFQFTQDAQFDVQGILLAGILIGAVGAIMDVAISIASSMEEVRKSNRSIRKIDLVKSGMNVGKDIMGTMANTLILAYVGAGLPLLMTLYGYGNTLFEIIHMEFLAVEILRTASGSIGLVLSIPITAVVTSMLLGSGNPRRR